jgi:cytoskeletal protein CcmA (bactofilin family)
MKKITGKLLAVLFCLVAVSSFAQETEAAPEKKKSKNSGKKSIISEGTVVKGDITTEADCEFDGQLIGNFASEAALLIGKSADIKGSVKADQVTVEGKYEGEMTVSGQLSVIETASVKGKASVGDLSVKPGATFIATTTMPDNYENRGAKKKKK